MCKICPVYGIPNGVGHTELRLTPKIVICSSAVAYLTRYIRESRRDFDERFLRDYARCYAILSHADFLAAQLALLEAAIPDRPAQAAETDWLRLSSILSYYETKCWFHEDVLLPLGLLSSEDFLYYIGLGYVLKDYGAGVRHGEFTHRLQWFVLSSVITANFTTPFDKAQWEHSPFEIYTSLAGSGSGNSLWGHMLDRDGKTGRPAFSYPDLMHATLLASQKNFPNLHKFLHKREKKRRHVFVRAISDYINANPSQQWDRTSLNAWLSADPGQADSAFNSFDRFRELEIHFLGTIRQEQKRVTTDPKAAEKQSVEIFTKTRDRDMPAYAEAKTKPPEHARPGHRTTTYGALRRGAVYALTGGDVDAAEKGRPRRIQQSRTALQ